MVDREIKQEYYDEIDAACRVLYQLELDIDPDDRALNTFTKEERIANKAYQRAFWFKFKPDTKDLEEYTERDLAKFISSNGNIAAHENWVHYPKKMQLQVQSKIEELTFRDLGGLTPYVSSDAMDVKDIRR